MWQYLIVWVVTAVLSALLAPRPKTTTPKPGQVEAPRLRHFEAEIDLISHLNPRQFKELGAASVFRL